MKPLLADYIFSDSLRYEGHRLFYSVTNEDRIEIGGFLAAAVLGALLYGRDEGRERGILLNIRDGRKEFFDRYEDETLHENGGLFSTELQALSEAYMDLNGDMTTLLSICGNERLCDLALGLMVDYMEQLVKEQTGEQIYDVCPWTGPFAQWLFNAGYIETRRQHLLSINWTDPVEVNALSEKLSSLNTQPSTLNSSPTFVFDGLSAEQVLNGYWTWLWDTVQQEANLFPDAKLRLAEYKKQILANETTYDFLKPEMKDFTPEQLNLFRSWMNKWVDFVQSQIEPPAEPKRQKKEEKQLFFPDEVLQCPTEFMKEKYAATREYVKERSRYDEEFRKFAKNESFAKLCRQLTMLFDWYVDPDSLRKSMLRKPKRKTKKYV